MIIVYPSRRFKKSYKSLPKHIKEKTKNKDSIFRDNPFDPRLKTHRLKGELVNYWSYSVNRENTEYFFVSKIKIKLFILI